MTVWPARILEAAHPEPADTLAYISKTTASFVHVSLEGIKDQALPENSAGSEDMKLDFWPHSGTTEWVMFEWDKKKEISNAKVYWFDDSKQGGCRLPKSWRILYKADNGEFKPVENKGAYGTDIDKLNNVDFDPISTSALKLEVVLHEEWSAGIQEVIFE